MSGRDLVDDLIALAIERGGVDPDRARVVEMKIRAQFGGRRFYVRGPDGAGHRRRGPTPRSPPATHHAVDAETVPAWAMLDAATRPHR